MFNLNLLPQPLNSKQTIKQDYAMLLKALRFSKSDNPDNNSCSYYLNGKMKPQIFICYGGRLATMFSIPVGNTSIVVKVFDKPGKDRIRFYVDCYNTMVNDRMLIFGYITANFFRLMYRKLVNKYDIKQIDDNAVVYVGIYDVDNKSQFPLKT